MRYVVVGVIAWAALAGPQVARAAPVAAIRLAVMEFANTSADHELDPLGKGLQSMVTTDLAQVASLTLVERARLADVEGELKLGASRAIDPATAVKLGKLAGATHLVSGTFTVVGDRMRLDGRIVGVADGKVVLAEQIEGERDAFFELEKSLVGKIVGAVGVVLAAKERGAVARIHTTDFGAFRAFSQGVALADDKKYAEAVAALRAAQARDQDFKLAAVTLTEYEAILAGLHARADELETAQHGVARAQLEGEARAEAEALDRLREVADRKPGDPLDRLAALAILATAYGNVSKGSSDLYRMQGLGDRFALRRIAAGMIQRYWTEALAMFPRVMPVVRGDLKALPKTAASVDEALARTRQQLLDAGMTPRVECTDFKQRDTRLLCNLDWLATTGDPVEQLPEWLALDAHQIAALHQRLYDLGMTLAPPAKWRQRLLGGLAHDYRRLGDFGRSTAYYTQLAALLTEPDAVRKITREIEKNREAASAVAASSHRAELVELIGNRSFGRPRTDDALALAARESHDRDPRSLRHDLAWSREFPSSGRIGGANPDLPLWIGDHQVWVMQLLQKSLFTGPRSDPFRASAIHYAPDRSRPSTLDSVLIVDGVARRDVRLGVELDTAPPRDLTTPTSDGPYEADPAGRADVGFVFGVRDVWSQAPVERSGLRSPQRPSHGYAVVVDDTGVRLDELIDQGDKPSFPMEGGVVPIAHVFAHKLLARQASQFRAAAKRTLALAIAGDQLTVTVNGVAFRFAAPVDRDGFYGLAITGAGYVELRAIK